MLIYTFYSEYMCENMIFEIGIFFVTLHTEYLGVIV